MAENKNRPILRILHIVGKMETGGLETLIMNWYRALDKTKIQFDFLTHYSEKGFYDDEIESYGGKVYHLSISNDRNYIKYKQDLNNFFQEHKEYKIVHAHHAAFGQFYLLAAKINKVPIRISHSHTASYIKTLRGFMVYLSSRRFKNYATEYFACSRAAGRFMYGNNKDFTIINNGIDTDKYIYSDVIRNRIRQELNLGDAYTLIHVGRFAEVKNHSFLIDIFLNYKEINPSSKLLLIGVGPLQNKIRDKVKNLGLESSVIFMNQVHNVQDYLSASDIFVFPSLYEGLPLTLVEAQSSGLPIICSDTITDETKLTSLYYNMSLESTAKEWAEKINELSFIKPNRRNLNEEVRSKGFDCKDVVKNLESVYMEYFLKLHK